MYSWEITNFLAEHNYHIGGDDLLFIINPKNHPQINHIQYNPYENKYEMWDDEGNYFCFWPIPYEEVKKQEPAKQKILKK